MQQIVALEARLRELIAEWERFFSGDRRVPPQAERDHLAQRLRTLAEHPSRRASERFRAEQLQHRFMAYAANWERMLREREEGRARIPAGRPAAVQPPHPDTPRPGAVDDSEEALLYERYRSAKRRAGQEVGVERTAFVEQIGRQRRELESKLGGSVRFDVVVKDGRVTLAARRVASQRGQEST